MRASHLIPDEFHGEWNYAIIPAESGRISKQPRTLPGALGLTPPTAIRRNIENGDLLQRRENHLGPFAGKGLTEDELKRLDKAATVMKVGVKMVKNVLRARHRRPTQAGGSGCLRRRSS